MIISSSTVHRGPSHTQPAGRAQTRRLPFRARWSWEGERGKRRSACLSSGQRGPFVRRVRCSCGGLDVDFSWRARSALSAFLSVTGMKGAEGQRESLLSSSSSATCVLGYTFTYSPSHVLCPCRHTSMHVPTYPQPLGLASRPSVLTTSNKPYENSMYIHAPPVIVCKRGSQAGQPNERLMTSTQTAAQHPPPFQTRAPHCPIAWDMWLHLAKPVQMGLVSSGQARPFLLPLALLPWGKA